MYLMGFFYFLAGIVALSLLRHFWSTAQQEQEVTHPIHT